MKKWIVVIMVAVFAFVAGCNIAVDPNANLKEQQTKKQQQANILMSKVPVPEITDSIERRNIAQRIVVTNNPAQVGWAYLLGGDSTVIARFPVRGKVTSGNKRLTRDQMYDCLGSCNTWEAPDEMGAYGSSNPYIFFFTPSGMLVQWQGDYLYTSEPYMMNPKTKQIEYVVDDSEMAKIAAYKDQIVKTPLEKAKGGQ